MKLLLHTQPHAQIHAAATGLVLLAGSVLELAPVEWACVAGAIGLVWMAEAINTAFEFLVDLVSPGEHPIAGSVKDLAAAAVLAAAVTAVVIGALVFGPKLLPIITR